MPQVVTLHVVPVLVELHALASARAPVDSRKRKALHDATRQYLATVDLRKYVGRENHPGKMKTKKSRGALGPCGFSLYGKAKDGAGKRTRTVDSHLGKVALYQLSYARISRFSTTEFPDNQSGNGA